MRDFVHVQDVADAFHAALQAALPGVHEVINVGTGVGTSIRDALAVVERVTGRQIPIVHRPARAEQAALIADPSRAAEVLSWQPRRSTIDEIVRSAWQTVVTQPH